MPNTGPSAGSRRHTHGALAELVERVAESDRGGGLALAGRRRRDRGDQDQLARRAGRRAAPGSRATPSPCSVRRARGSLPGFRAARAPAARSAAVSRRCAISMLLGNGGGSFAGCCRHGASAVAVIVRGGHATRACLQPCVGVGYNRRRCLWLKAFHVVFVVTWFAGLFYLPRLFVYHVADHRRARAWRASCSWSAGCSSS